MSDHKLSRVVNRVKESLAGVESGQGYSQQEAKFLSGVDRITKAPVPTAVWLTPILICGLFVVALLWAIFSTVDIVSQATGVLAPKGRIKYVQSPGQYVVKRILVKDGQKVRREAPLIEFDFTSQKAQKEKITQELITLRLEEARTAALVDICRDAQAGKRNILPGKYYTAPDNVPAEILSDEQLLFQNTASTFRLQQTSYISQINKLKVSLEMGQAAVEHAKSVHQIAEVAQTRMENLLSKGLASQEQLDAARQNAILAKSDSDLKTMELKAVQADMALKELERDNFIQSFLQDNLNRLITARQNIKTAQQELIRLDKELEYEVLSAPDDGMVLNTVIHTVGGVVSPAQVLMEIVPEGGELELEAMISNRDIGFIKAGDPVRVKMDTFTFTRYGYIDGTIREVAKNSIMDQKLGMVFKVWISLEAQEMQIEGRQVSLSAGETATVDILTGKRRIIDYILSRILEYKDEAMRER